MTIKFGITDVAESIPFDNSTNGFSADNLQDAIEEIQTSIVGGLMNYDFMAKGNIKNAWLKYSNSPKSSNEIPLVCPQAADLNGIVFISVDNDVDMDIEIYKNGTLVYTDEVRNKRWYYNVGLSSGVSFAQGDRISVYLKEYSGGTGDQTAQNPTMNLLLKFVTEVTGSGGEQNGVT